MSNDNRERWGSRIGVILAVAGSAVGLGNFLRFPGQAAQNGGGAFMLPYFIALLVLGIPLCWAEWTMGRYAGTRGFNSAPGIFSVIWQNPVAKYFGSIALLIPLIIYMYYVLIESWCLLYALDYLTGAIYQRGDTTFAEHFSSVTGKNGDGELIKSGYMGLIILLITFGLNFLLIYRGVTKGIEALCRVAMPLMAVLAIIVLVRVLTLGTPDPTKPGQSVIGGLAFMWEPKPEKLWEPQTWLAASGQIFFSLSVGFGVIINYASYLNKRDDVVLSGLTSTAVNEFFEVCLGGLITLPAAFIFLGTSAGTQGTFGLGFVALPEVFEAMPMGRWIGFMWFLMLFFAAITSSVSMLQPVIAFLEEGFALKRHSSVAILGIVSLLGCGFVAYHSKDTIALDTLDFWVGTVLIFLLALVQSLIYGWIFGIKRGEEEAHLGAHLRIPCVVQYMLKYVVPVYLVTIFVMFCVTELPSKLKQAFVVPVTATSLLHDGAVTEKLTEHLLTEKIDPKTVADIKGLDMNLADVDLWVLRNKDGKQVYQIERNPNGDLALFSYSTGSLETISNSPVALHSILLVVGVMFGLNILIYFAGRRWRREGRFANDRLSTIGDTLA